MLAAILVSCAAAYYQALVPAAQPSVRLAEARLAPISARPLRLRAPAPQGTLAAATNWALPWALSVVAGVVSGALASRSRRGAVPRRGRDADKAASNSDARSKSGKSVVMSASASYSASASVDARLRNGKAVVMFTSPWCGPCKLADPIFKELKNSRDYPEINFIKVDIGSEEGKAMCEKYEIQGLPTILYFNDGDAFGSPSRGARAACSLEQDVHDLAGAARPSLFLAGLEA